MRRRRVKRGFGAAHLAGELAPWRRGAALLAPALLVALGGCGGAPTSVGPGLGARNDSYDPKWGVSSSRRVIVDGPIPKGGGHHKLGRPYQVGGRWYVPRHEPYYDRSGVGSWYGKEFHGRKTANGEIFDMDALTAAHPTLPMPSYAYVTNLRNGRTLLVRINDRGPYVANREIDLSRASAQALGYANGGLGQVRVRWAGHAPLDGDDRREQAFLRQQQWYRGGGATVASIAPPSLPPSQPSSHHRRDSAPYGEHRRREPDLAHADHAPPYASELSPQPERMTAAPHGERPRWRQPPPRYAEMHTGAAEVAAPYAPGSPPPSAPPADALWSPFDHRQQLGSPPRR
jgi:rare lipoprotein A